MTSLYPDWTRRRQQIVTAFIAAGTLVFAALWLFETRAGIITDLDRWAYPAIIAFLGVHLLIVASTPRLQPYAELACYLGVAFYLLGQMFYMAWGPPAESIYNIAVALVWMPSLYVAAFMFFSRRRAMLAVGITFSLSAVALISAAVIAGRRDDVLIPSLLINALASHLLVLLLLSLVMILRHEFERVSSHARSMEDAANTDPLTGIANRRALEEWLLGWDGQDVSDDAALVLIDIDHFKSINDAHGHLVGDEVLVSTAQLIRSQLRTRDVVGRWGGEEFLVIVESGSLSQAKALANRIRQIVNASVHPVAGSVTVSAGIAICSAGEPAMNAFRAADSALYAAKSSGRNRVEVT